MTLAIIVTRIEELINKCVGNIMAGYAKSTDLFSGNHNDLSNKGTRTHAQIDTILDDIESGNSNVTAHAISHASTGTDPITPESIGAANRDHSHAATAHSHEFSQITGDAADNENLVAFVEQEISSHAGYGNHAANHGSDGSDPITPASIGASASNHEHQWSEIEGSDPSANSVLDAYVKSLIGDGLSGSQIETILVSGTMVQTDGMTYTVSALGYLILGNIVTSTGGEIVFDVEDSEMRRIDVVYADAAGGIHILKGTPAYNPIKPALAHTYVEVAWLLIDGNNSELNNSVKGYTIVLPSSSTVQGRVNSATDYPDGWTMAADGTTPADLVITHSLSKEITNVTVWSLDGTAKRLLLSPANFAGIIAPDNNTLKIESLATIETPIVIHLTFT